MANVIGAHLASYQSGNHSVRIKEKPKAKKWRRNFKIFFDMLEEIIENKNASQGGQRIIFNQVATKSNGVGTAGFVLALIAIFLRFIPFFGRIIWFLGLVLSFAGVFKRPRGLAISCRIAEHKIG